MALNGKFWRNKKTGDLVYHRDNDNLAKFELFEIVVFKNGKEVKSERPEVDENEEEKKLAGGASMSDDKKKALEVLNEIAGKKKK